jgi:hypothetical protein
VEHGAHFLILYYPNRGRAQGAEVLVDCLAERGGEEAARNALQVLTHPYNSIAELMYPRGLMLNFSMYQSGIDFKCPYYSNRPLKPLTPLIGLTQSLFRGT